MGKQNTSARAPAKTQQNPGGHTTSGTSFPDPHSTSRLRRATTERASVPAPPPLVPTNEEELLTRWPIRSHTTNRSSARATPTPSRTSRTPRRHLPPTFTKSWTPLRVPPPHNSNASPVYSATPTAAAHTEPVNRPSPPRPTRQPAPGADRTEPVQRPIQINIHDPFQAILDAPSGDLDRLVGGPAETKPKGRPRKERVVRVRPHVQKLVRPHVQRSGGSIMPCAGLVLQSRRAGVLACSLVD
jgi:hypothetical protein